MKKVLKSLCVFSLLLLTILFVGACGEEKKSGTDETTNQLIVYIWASNTTAFYETDEIETIKKCYRNNYPDVKTIYHIMQNVTKEEFGEAVNNGNDADVILAGINMDADDGCDIELKTTDDTKKALIDKSWCKMDERYIGIAKICESTHLANAKDFRNMMINEMPELYKEQKVMFIGNSYTYYRDLFHYDSHGKHRIPHPHMILEDQVPHQLWYKHYIVLLPLIYKYMKGFVRRNYYHFLWPKFRIKQPLFHYYMNE